MDYISRGKEIIASKDGIVAAFGYGSSFFHQAGYNEKTVKSMDFIFVVDDLKEWFKNDISKNSECYTDNSKKRLLKLRTKKLKGKTGIIYNVVRNTDVKYKFGVIEKEDFLNHLSTWDSFYVTGRMQKPVYTFKSTEEIDEAINKNRKNVLIATLAILNKKEVTLNEMFNELCSLSYIGDIRFIIENPNKVSNIVKGSLENLVSIYSKYSEYIKIDGENVLVNLDKVISDIKLLPNNVKINNKNISNSLYKHIKRINFKESICQPLKGLKVTGIKDSLSYLKEKAKKKKLK